MAASRKAAIVGAGAAGIISAKVLLDAGWSPVVFEQSDIIGGTWNYDESHKYEFSSMYKNLRTNLPKELMKMDELDHDVVNRSFLDHEEVLSYLNKYVKKYNLDQVIEFETKITKVAKSAADNWLVTSHHLPSSSFKTTEYDSVFVCNGHYFEPYIPVLEGVDTFKGQIVHSHSYRVPEAFSGQVILIIGAGPSGMDISVDLSSYADKIYLSHHEEGLNKVVVPKSVEMKPDVTRFDENSVVFSDGSKCEVDTVIYCSGYTFSFPFLDDSCGVKVEENYVSPLYCQLINIPHPTMFFIGLPFRTFIFQMLELQAKCCVRILNGDAHLPSKEEMENARQLEIEKLKRRGFPKRKYHLVGPMAREYLLSVAEAGGLPPLDDVLFKILFDVGRRRGREFLKYRNYVYEILDANNFYVYYNDETEK